MLTRREMLIVGAVVSTTAISATAGASAAEDELNGAPDRQSERNKEKMMGQEKLRSLQEAKREDHGPLTRRALEFITVMDRVVNMDKEPAITAADWAPLGDFVDQNSFYRVGNFGERVNWQEYVDLLVRWANSSWWKEYIFRLREVPAAQGKPGLVYIESEERSNRNHPVMEDGDYNTLSSIAVWAFNESGKIISLHVYDQSPLR